MTIDIKGLLEAGAASEKAEKDSAEAGKTGYLRGGNSGSLIMQEDGTLASIGGCARKALLRMLGIEVPDGEDYNSKALLFQAGLSNEDMWTSWLERSWTGDGKVILRETDIPTRWETRNGTPVTGRPDIVLAQAKPSINGGRPRSVVGLELKQIASMWTVRDVLQDKPKAEHVAQSAHYSMALGVPFELWYASRVNHYVFGTQLAWIVRQFPRHEERHSEKLDYEMSQEVTPRARKDGKGMTKGAKSTMAAWRVLPFVHGFKLTWGEPDAEGSRTLSIRAADLPEEADRVSVVTEEGIREYYETAANAVASDVLPPRPAAKDVFGDDLKYTNCKYCPLQNVCDNYTGGTQGWLQEVKKQVDAADTNK
jgi:hypothetical protein